MSKSITRNWVVNRVYQDQSVAGGGFWNADIYNQTETTSGIIAQVIGQHRTWEAHDLVKKNASLVSAAPDLLAACKLMRDILRDNRNFTPDEFKQVQAALSKAGG